jgi:hypothetical protein
MSKSSLNIFISYANFLKRYTHFFLFILSSCCLFVLVSAHSLSICLFIYPSVYLFIYLSACLFVCYLPACVFHSSHFLALFLPLFLTLFYLWSLITMYLYLFLFLSVPISLCSYFSLFLPPS